MRNPIFWRADHSAIPFILVTCQHLRFWKNSSCTVSDWMAIASSQRLVCVLCGFLLHSGLLLHVWGPTLGVITTKAEHMKWATKGPMRPLSSPHVFSKSLSGPFCADKHVPLETNEYVTKIHSQTISIRQILLGSLIWERKEHIKKKNVNKTLTGLSRDFGGGLCLYVFSPP